MSHLNLYDVLGVIVIALFLLSVIGMSETGRYPWEK